MDTNGSHFRSLFPADLDYTVREPASAPACLSDENADHGTPPKLWIGLADLKTENHFVEDGSVHG